MVRRACALVLTVLVAVVASIAWAVAAPSGATAAPVPERAPGGACSTEEWQRDMRGCVDRLADVTENRARCLTPPTPSTPDSGLAGWFAERPASSSKPGPKGYYSIYGYAGYSYTTYDLDNGCASTLIDPEYKFETTVANGEFMIATAIIGASNALRERAWDPQSLWGWADPLVEEATKAVYQKVFSVFGVITLAIVGLYLMWRSRQADMGAATTTAGWAILIMVAVTAIAAWPVRSANIADESLIGTLGVVHDAVGPRAQTSTAGKCDDPTPGACEDNRPPAVRASDTATETMLYRNWLRGLLGSADSETAKKYGRALYDARSLTWDEAQRLRNNPEARGGTLDRKKEQWEKVAEQISQEDPEAYEYLQGINGIDRIGAGFIAVLAAIMFAMFDLTASLLVLLGFLIFRWAVIAAPILGTVGLLRPASAGIRRLGNAVVAALFNIAIFGTGAAIYLFAVDLIMNTGSLAGWLQVVLVWLCGVVGWLLLRPYRRITQLGGKDSTRAIASAGGWHRRFFRDMREAAKLEVAEGGGTREPVITKGRGVYVEQTNLRPEARLEDPAHAANDRRELTSVSASESRDASERPSRPDGLESVPDEATSARTPTSAGPARSRRAATWSEPDVAERPSSYAIYRPETQSTTRETAEPRVRTEAK
ncbi:DMT family transporter [Jidongwangia harbinensis]|uniref:DMT family transporter n=1 Tax=Jidongwangia harbinensis TaxID=2878561 RepID=UPI001CDA0AEC|nr:DMT family transporter [Jidongwangia harbinensis]MCA2215869.1 DMT family transporter [Jidongwangia harbinensis]